jgi:hypothetical protein
VLGDIWHLGGHRLLCGDALDQATLSRLLMGERAAATFTDPPYNVKIDGHVSGTGKVRHREFPMAVGEMSVGEFTSFLTSSLTNICQHTQPGALLFTCMDWRHMTETVAAGAARTLFRSLQTTPMSRLSRATLRGSSRIASPARPTAHSPSQLTRSACAKGGYSPNLMRLGQSNSSDPNPGRSSRIHLRQRIA